MNKINFFRITVFLFLINSVFLFAWAGRIDRTQLGEVLQNHQEIFSSSLERYEDQINYFNDMKINPEMKKKFFEKFNEGITASNAEDVLKLLIYYTSRYIVAQSHNIIVSTSMLSKLQENLLAVSDEVLLYQVSRVFNQFLKSRSDDLDFRNIVSQVEFKNDTEPVIPCTFSGLEKTAPPYNQYLIEEATLKFQDRELLLRSLYPFISEAYLDIESLFQLEGDLYLKWMLSHEKSELINPNAAGLFYAYQIDINVASSQVATKFYRQKKQKFSIMGFSNPYEFMINLRDYKKIIVPDESSRKHMEENFKRSRKRYPLPFRHIQRIRRYDFDVLNKFIGIPKSIIYALGLSDLPVSTESKSVDSENLRAIHKSQPSEEFS